MRSEGDCLLLSEHQHLIKSLTNVMGKKKNPCNVNAGNGSASELFASN